MSSQHSLRDLVVLVTGASSGIGEEAARQFAHAGASVVLAARRAERLERLAGEIRQHGGAALPVPTDLTDPEQITRLVETTMNVFGRIDVLANIAGWGRYDWFEELSYADLRGHFDVNVLGLAELTRQVIPVMKAQRSGHILNMSSYASKVAVPPLTVYASTKYAVEGLSDGLRRELMPWGIYVTRIHPSGVTGTEFNQKAGQNGGVKYRSFPLGRVSRAAVARRLVALVERPQRAVFLSRLYEVPLFFNRNLPGLVDLLSAAWVKYKRREQFQRYPSPSPKTVTYPSPRLRAFLLLTAAAVITRLLKPR